MEKNQNSKTVILATYATAFEAEVVKGALQAEGIPAILQGENFSRLYGTPSAASINLLVLEEDIEEARKIIEGR